MQLLRAILLVIICLCFSSSILNAQETVNDSLGTKLRLIHGGRFIQGMSGGERVLEQDFPLSTVGQFYGNAEDPAHVTWITKPYYIAETEVTVAQFQAFVKATGYQTSAETAKTQMVGWEPTPEEKPLYQSYDFTRSEKFNWKNPGFEQKPNHPVVGISHADAKAFCEWLSNKEGVTYRLPTEAEWEFACRAGTQTYFSFGDNAKGVVHQYGNLGNAELEKFRKHAAERQWLLDWENAPEDGFVFTSPVGNFQANPWGLHDMHGNVWEWCEDLWLDTVYKDFSRPKYNKPTLTALDPVNRDRPQTSTNDFHTIRGGCWYNGDLPCRSSNRTYWDREDAACYIGFRIVREAGENIPRNALVDYESEKQAIQSIEAAGGEIFSSRGLDLEVRFSGNQIDESAIYALSELRDFKRLNLGWRQRDALISQSAFNAIAELSELESLELGDNVNPDEVNLSVLSKLKNLKVLHFPRSRPLNDSHLKSLASLKSLTDFRCFGTGGGLTDQGLKSISGNRSLEQLHIDENEATGEFLKNFVGCPLKGMTLTGIYNTPGKLNDEGVLTLVEFPLLETLTISRQPELTGKAMNVIVQLKHLQRLQLEDCPQMQDKDFVELSALSRLQYVELKQVGAGDRAAAAVARIPRIRSVQFRSEELTDQGIKDLAAAYSIQQLILFTPQITDQGLQSLGRINQLKSLMLYSENVTGKGLGPLCNLPQLNDLTLITPALTDVAFDYLSQCRSLLKLKLVYQGYRPPAALTNAGIMKMSSATWLRELWLPRNGTKITEDQILKLNQLMTNTGVIPYTATWKE
ncbi:formylglycine-generating enzyme family protein [Rubinisphaera sp.]|uniref:formylglycine-generating enzyme family protein n=1 Tax=Rubinisphaera sp. TaxID=2024857 RepID=UPI000C0C6B74|nr:formylglycine-generating enzyme family protein [Rubinisphaera sp.]MBV12268.1 hypothetical protein [Rubinisphaera sp.]